MVIKASAPARISLFGGGTDVPSYANKEGSVIVSMAINIRSNVFLRTEDDIFNFLGRSQEYPPDANPNLFYEILNHFKLGGMHQSSVKSEFEGFIGAGLGSSASASVALIAAIYKYLGRDQDRYKIAKDAWNIEVNKLGWYGGKQDQLASAFGGFNRIDIGKNISVRSFDHDKGEEILKYLVLIYVGGKRESKKIQKGFKKLTRDQQYILSAIKNLAQKAIDYIYEDSTKYLGLLLNDSWELKKKSNNVSNERIDSIYDLALKSGADGGKLLGAGQAGYMLFFVPPAKREKFIKKMRNKGFEDIDFSIDYQGIDVRIL